MVSRSKINDDDNVVPDNVIAIITQGDIFRNSVHDIVQPLLGNKKRDWFTPHFYFCLPLVIGNQYGFIIRSYYSWSAIWNGTSGTDAITINIENPDPDPHQLISSHFGSGIVTVQNRFHFRTPPGINLVTFNPPNFLMPDIQNLTGVIEADNLRRDFTFNLKITEPNKEIKISKGQPIAALFPIPRYFVDDFKIKIDNELFSDEVIRYERIMGSKFSYERRGPDTKKPHGAGRRYWKGEDADGNKFIDHQTRFKK